MFKDIYFEICGKCNAKCRYCPTGQATLSGASIEGNFIKIESFSKAISYLLQNDFIGKKSVIHLYNWGEPFLNPDLPKIIDFLNNEDIRFALSTNGSVVRFFEKGDILRNLTYLRFSMPGFSQESYSRIHGFNFSKVIGNIRDINNNFRQSGFQGTTEMFFHVYQFNQGELKQASDFANSIGAELKADYALFNGVEMYLRYLKQEMDYSELYTASKEMMLYYIDGQLKNRPHDYACPQFGSLALDENCNVVTCCGLEKNASGYAVGNLFELSIDEVRKIKKPHDICYECQKNGVDYLLHNLMPVKIGTFVNIENNKEAFGKYGLLGSLRKVAPRKVKDALKSRLPIWMVRWLKS